MQADGVTEFFEFAVNGVLAEGGLERERVEKQVDVF